MLKIRLSMGGVKKRPIYKIVIADSRYPRDGKFVEKVGSFNPLLPKNKEERIKVEAERIKYWISKGAKPTLRVSRILGEAKIRVGVTHTDFNNSYLQACCMVFNKDCISFFKEILNHYQDFNNNVYPYGDESIINCMIWRDKLPNNLGDVFLCTHYFSPYIIEAALKAKTSEEYNNLFENIKAGIASK